MPFNLPTPDGATPGTLTADGLLYRGKTIPYTEITKFKAASDEELEVHLKTPVRNEEGEDTDVLLFEISEGSSHQLLDLKTMVETAMMQKGLAEFAPGNPNEPEETAGEKITNAPVFDMKKVRKSFAKAYAMGG